MSLRIGKFPDNKGGSCLQDIVIEVNKILEEGTGGSVNIPDEIITDISVDPNSTNTTQVGLEIIKDKSGVEETTQIYIESASDTKAGVMSSDDKIELSNLRTDLTQAQTDIDNIELNVDELQDDVEALENKMTTVENTLTEVENSTLNYDFATKKIQLLHDGDVVSEIDAAEFIKDGMVNSVTLNQDSKSVTITFNTDAGKEDITVDFSDIYDVLLTEAKGYVDGKVGTNEYTNTNYISKETNLTDAALQLDEEIKATNDNLAILNAATIKGVKLANRPIAETPISGIVTIPAASSDTDYGLMSQLDKSKIDSILSSGDGTKFLADDFTYKTIQMPDLSTYATKTELSGYLPLSGGTLTGILKVPYTGIQTDNGNSLLRFNDSEYWIGNTGARGVWETSNQDLLHRKNGTNYTIYDSGNLDISSFVTTSGTNNVVFPTKGIVLGTADANEYNSYYINRSGYRTELTNSSNSTILSIQQLDESGISSVQDSRLTPTLTDLIFNNNHVITTADTFNTITYTTSASEDNLRAWNNYVNGYVTNLRIVDSTLTSYIGVVNGVDIENKKFDVYVIGGDPIRLVRAEYTLADNGSVTKSTDSYTLTPVTV